MRITAAIAFLCAFLIAPAHAQHQAPVYSKECNVTMPCDFSYSAPVAQKPVRRVAQPVERPARERGKAAGSSPASSITEVVEHPEGCPKRAFCGCGAALRVFGHQVRHLWLAANWFRFPRADPAPGMVAVRQHHVFVLEVELDRGLWLAYDANSGQHLTRIHPRALTGYTIVNPHPS